MVTIAVSLHRELLYLISCFFIILPDVWVVGAEFLKLKTRFYVRK